MKRQSLTSLPVWGLFTCAFGTACGAGEPGDEIMTVEQPAICNANDFQNVETYVPADGVPRSFIDEHQGPVGSFGCSGTLIGDGLFLTVAHCVDSGPYSVAFNHQLDPNLQPRTETVFERAEIIEDDGASQNALLRLHYSPENFFGMTGLENRTMVKEDKLVVIGHPYQLNHPTNENGSTYKVAEVGRVNSVTSNDINYKHLDTRGGMSGSGVLAADSGRLIGIHRAGHDDGYVCNSVEAEGTANTITRIFRVSNVIKGDRGSGHFFKNYGWQDNAPLLSQLTNVGNWRSAWHHIIPGRFGTGSLDALFFYDSTAGFGRFYYVNSSRTITGIGAGISGMRKTWSLITPIDVDGTGTSELLFYDARDGFGAFYATDGAGNLTELRHDSSWGRNWNQIVAADLIPSRPGPELVFYSRRLHSFHAYRTTTTPTIGKLKENSATTSAGDVIPTVLVAGDFSPDSAGRMELFAYAAPTGRAFILRFADDGTMSVVSSATLPKKYSQIAAGDFMTAPGTELLAYSPSDGTAVVYQTYGGTISAVSTQTGLRNHLSKLVAGNFMGGDGTEALFYDRFRSADPDCSTGVVRDNICCEAQCGTCGGTGCGSRPGGADSCCMGNISTAGRSCADNPPPCVMP
jgi:V8-like Glu-specific endopeptidase